MRRSDSESEDVGWVGVGDRVGLKVLFGLERMSVVRLDIEELPNIYHAGNYPWWSLSRAAGKVGCMSWRSMAVCGEKN